MMRPSALTATGLLLLCLLAAPCAHALTVAPTCNCGGMPPCGGGCAGLLQQCNGGTCLGMFGGAEPCAPCPNACGTSFCPAGQMCAVPTNGTCVPFNCKNIYLYRCRGNPSVALDTSCSSGGADCAKAPDGSFACMLNGGAQSISC